VAHVRVAELVGGAAFPPAVDVTGWATGGGGATAYTDSVLWADRAAALDGAPGLTLITNTDAAVTAGTTTFSLCCSTTDFVAQAPLVGFADLAATGAAASWPASIRQAHFVAAANGCGAALEASSSSTFVGCTHLQALLPLLTDDCSSPVPTEDAVLRGTFVLQALLPWGTYSGPRPISAHKAT